MTERTQELLQEALSLPDAERPEIVGSLLVSLDTNIDSDVDAVWRHELALRLDEVRSGKLATIPWDQVQRKARTLLGGR
jgi:putative addiction module component (TIGR02574 family)